MLVTLGNETIQVRIDTFGAELKSLQTIPDQHEYLWTGSEDSWNGSSPILFPIIGALNDDCYIYGDSSYTLASHGFARKLEFAVTSQTFDSITFSLSSTEETLAVYPFEFILHIIYTIQNNTLRVSCEVHNKHDGSILFSIGGHPGFNCPLDEGLKFTDYQVVFEKKERVMRRFKNGKVLSGKRESFLKDEDTILLNHVLFKEGALIFDDLKSQRVTLMSPKGPRKVHMDYTGFPYFGIWTYPRAPQDYLCLEPWYGVDSTVGDEPGLKKKEGLVSLGSGESFYAEYTIGIE